MKVRVLFFAELKDRFGAERETELADGMCVGELADRIGIEAPVVFAVNEEFAGPDAVLKDADSVAFMRPMSGGAG